MQVQDIPGQVIHIRMEGTSVAVTFERVPWTFHIADMAGAIEAFSNGDWFYFQSRWWDAHQHLQLGSETLNTLVTTLDAEQLYCPATILEHGLSRGIYREQSRQIIEQDYHRLALLPQLCCWPRGGTGMITRNGQPPTGGWTGQMWCHAILEDKGIFRDIPESLPLSDPCAGAIA